MFLGISARLNSASIVVFVHGITKPPLISRLMEIFVHNVKS
jgi:hypothetical protein